ncbi:hypothetical protein Patl1_36877 [Pistacia atlantica]|nr:hypothetical protein Patl1_36877 [Pistacia atlantica]
MPKSKRDQTAYLISMKNMTLQGHEALQQKRKDDLKIQSFLILIQLFMMELSSGPPEQFTREMEPLLRKQGMPVQLNKVEPYCFLLAALHHTFKEERLCLNINFILAAQGWWNLFQILLYVKRESLYHLSQLAYWFVLIF